MLFEAHARAEGGERQRAQALVQRPRIIDFAAVSQRRLALALSERYGLADGASGVRRGGAATERRVRRK